MSKVKVEVHRRTGYEGPEGVYRYSSTLSLTSALEGVGGKGQATAALPLGKTRYPLYRRLGLDGCEKSCPPTRIRSPDRPARSESLYQLRYPDSVPPGAGN